MYNFFGNGFTERFPIFHLTKKSKGDIIYNAVGKEATPRNAVKIRSSPRCREEVVSCHSKCHWGRKTMGRQARCVIFQAGRPATANKLSEE